MPDIPDQCDNGETACFHRVSPAGCHSEWNGEGECPDRQPMSCATCGEDPVNGPCPPDCLPRFNHWTPKAAAPPEPMLDVLRCPVDDEYVIEQATVMAREFGAVSVSLLQRRLRIGYVQAARCVDIMQERGIIDATQLVAPCGKMKPWWDNPEYHSATVDGKIAAWAEHCHAIERQLQASLDHERLKVAALCEALDNPAQGSEQWGRWADARATSARHDRQEVHHEEL